VNTIGDRRLYVTAQALNMNPEIANYVATRPIVLRNQIDCFSYSILSSSTDVQFDVQNYQGATDLLVAIAQKPRSVTSSYVKLHSKDQSPWHRVIVRAIDRQFWN